MINDQGGINGRKINLVSVDDGYSPLKTFEQTRKLVEQDEVAFIFPASEHGLASSYANISTKARSRSYLNAISSLRRDLVGRRGAFSMEHRLVTKLSDGRRYLWSLSVKATTGAKVAAL